MSYYGDKETYVPKFKVGDKVYHDRDKELVRTVTARKVTRNAQRCDTRYTLDDTAASKITEAWEMWLQPVTELLEPSAVLARILPMFDAPVYMLTVEPDKVGLAMSAESWVVKLLAVPENGKVQTLGEWKWHVLKPETPTATKWTAQSGTAPNLGRAVVDASNTLHGHTS